MRKFIRMVAAAMEAFFCLQIVAFAEGDPNVDNGGGGLKDGTSENFWNPGNDGVRITVVDSENGTPKSASYDYTNTNASDIALHFGKISKAKYVGGTELSADIFRLYIYQSHRTASHNYQRRFGSKYRSDPQLLYR